MTRQRKPTMLRELLTQIAKCLPPEVFEGTSVRVTLTGLVAAVDVLTATGCPDPGKRWSQLKKSHPVLAASVTTHPLGGGGRPTDVLAEEQVDHLLTLTAGPRAAEFRTWVADLFRRYRSGDVVLVDEPSERKDNPEDAVLLSLRASARESHLAVELALRRAGGTRVAHREVAVLLCRYATG